MSFIHNLSSQLLSTTLAGGLALLLSIILGRLMGPDIYGPYNYVLSLAAIFSVLQDGGFRTFILREKATSTTEDQIAEQRLIPLSLGHLLLTTILGIAGALIFFSHEIKYAMALAVMVLGSKIFSGFVSAYLRGNGDFVTEAHWKICISLINVFAVLMGWFIWHNTIGTLFACLLGQMICLLLPASKRYLRKPQITFSKTIFKTGAAFLAIDAATALYFRIDIALLESLQDNTSVLGHYSAVYRLLEGVIFVLTPISVIFFRQLRLHWQDSSRFNKNILLQLTVMFLLAFVTFVGIWLTRDWIITITFGDDYRSASAIIPWLFASLFFVLPNGVLTQAMIALNKEWHYAFAAIIAALANIVLNFLLIPTHNMFGAAWATIIAEAILFFYLSTWLLINAPTRSLKRED